MSNADMLDCPQCGEETPELHEGYCADCCGNNQAELDRHNFEYEQWQIMDNAKRDEAIRNASR